MKRSFTLGIIVLILVPIFFSFHSIDNTIAGTPVTVEYVDQEDWDNWKLNSEGYNSSCYSILTDSKGVFHIVWSEYSLVENHSRLLYCTYNQIFSEKTLLLEIYNVNFTYANIPMAYGFKAMLDNSDKLHLLYYDLFESLMFKHLIFTEGILTDSHDFEGFRSGYLLKDPENNIHFVGAKYGTGDDYNVKNIYYASYNGISWSTPQMLTAYNEFEDLDIIDAVISRSGKICIVFNYELRFFNFTSGTLETNYNTRSLYYDGHNWLEQNISEISWTFCRLAFDDLDVVYMVQYDEVKPDYSSLDYSRYKDNLWESYRTLKLYESIFETGLYELQLKDMVIIGSDVFIALSIWDDVSDSHIYLLHTNNCDDWKLYPIFQSEDYFSWYPLVTANEDGSVFMLDTTWDNGNWSLIAFHKNAFFDYKETSNFPGYTMLITLLSLVSMIPVMIVQSRKQLKITSN